jgi:hypothetical protein
MSEIIAQITNVLPDFRVDKCRWIHRLDVWEAEHGRCCRLVVCFDNRVDLSFVATGVREFTLGNRERTPGSLPYAPYDLGEFFIQKLSPERYILADELKGWRIVADSLVFEGKSDHDEATDSTAGAA